MTLAESTQEKAPQLDFLWLETTNRCNMQCAHCSVSSSPWSGDTDRLSKVAYERLLDESYEMGCRHVQFIGGEPTLNKDLPSLIAYANNVGFSTIQLYTNLFAMSDEVIDVVVRFKVDVKTSVYGPTAEVHDAVTKHPGSFNGTIRNIQQLKQQNISVKAAVIEMEENRGQALATLEMLEQIDVEVSGYEKARHVGRADDGTGGMHELCGECAGNTAFVGADGKVSPCTMSTSWPVGTITEEVPLSNIIGSQTNNTIRRQIGDAISEQHDNLHAICAPKACGPYDSCSPKYGPGPCAPSGCFPCRPMG